MLIDIFKPRVKPEIKRVLRHIQLPDWSSGSGSITKKSLKPEKSKLVPALDEAKQVLLKNDQEGEK